MKDTSFSQTFGDCKFILFMLFLPVSLPVRFPVEGLDERINGLNNPGNLVLLQSVGEEGIECIYEITHSTGTRFSASNFTPTLMTDRPSVW